MAETDFTATVPVVHTATRGPNLLTCIFAAAAVAFPAGLVVGILGQEANGGAAVDAARKLAAAAEDRTRTNIVDAKVDLANVKADLATAEGKLRTAADELRSCRGELRRAERDR